jgi:hypothetical protein
MERRLINLLKVSDEDLECSAKRDEKTLKDLKLKDLSFNRDDLEKFDLIVYSGVKGSKILKSRYFNTGKIG